MHTTFLENSLLHLSYTVTCYVGESLRYFVFIKVESKKA